MKTNKNIDEEINKTLSSLDGTSDVNVEPYFYTRLSAKMESNESQTATIWNWSLAAMTLIIMINVVSLLSLWPKAQDQEEVMDLMASEYSLTNTDIYSTDLEQE